MAKFTKKAVEIDAVQWTGSNHSEIEEFCPAIRYSDTSKTTPVIDTLEGFHSASRGDWIIKGVKDEFYPCKPDIFALTYETDSHLSALADLAQPVKESSEESGS